jgi:hypothetical protein
MLSAVEKFFVAPTLPNLAAGFAAGSFAVVNLQRARGAFSLASSAVTQLPSGLLVPSFDEPNIGDASELTDIIVRTAEAAGLSNRKRWSVALPDGAVRTVVMGLETKPAGRRELDDIVSWKIERLIGASPEALRTNRQRLTPAGGQERYLVTVAREEVVAQYESILFENLGWQAGLLLPAHLGEAQWLTWDQMPGDKMLISACETGFTSVIVRNREPLLVRTHSCETASRGDELHRFSLYYRDRLPRNADGSGLTRLLVLGGFDPDEARRAVLEATDSTPSFIDPSEFGFDLAGEPIRFDQVAGAAGLASLCYR